MYKILGSIVVSISACHAEDPGSIPGRGVLQQAARCKTRAFMLLLLVLLQTFSPSQIKEFSWRKKLLSASRLAY